ncbi:hypothetical protein M9458_008297, partial [Cirrhinus mrigala]
KGMCRRLRLMILLVSPPLLTPNCWRCLKHVLLNAHRRGCPPAAATPAPPPVTQKEVTPQKGRRAGRRKTAQPAAQV